MLFWKIITGVGVIFFISLLYIINSDISFTSISDTHITGLDQKTLYLGENEPCGVSSVECRPGLICESVLESTISGGVCKKPDFDGPFDIRPEIPKYDNSKEFNYLFVLN